MRPLTSRQREVLRAIQRLTKPRGPTVRELCKVLGIRSSASGQRHIEALQFRGLVTERRMLGEPRGIVLTPEGELEIQRLREEA